MQNTDDMPRKRLKKSEIETLFARLKEHNPEPEGELEFSDPYTLLVAVVLSAQATDKGVNKATRKLFPVADTPQKMVGLGIDGIKQYIRTIGLYNAKAENVYKLSRALIDHHSGGVPADQKALEALPGVGRKTANVVMNIAFGIPTIAVDTHIFRVSNRTGTAPGKTPREVERTLMHVVPEEYRLHAHHWLILHGRYICTARKPKCPECPINDICLYPDKTKN